MTSHGTTPEGLVRTLGPIAAGAFVVTNMIGSGIFTTPAVIFLVVTIAAWINGLIDAPLPAGAALGTMAVGGTIYILGARLG